MATVPAKWAVLVGVDFYRGDPKVVRLSGCVNDVEYAASLLQQHFAPINITKFVAEDTKDPLQFDPLGGKDIWPTYDNITSKLERIIQLASPGDHVHFHYSGHGTLKSTRKMDYRIGARIDAALVLFEDASAWGVRYLRGIEMHALFDRMVKKQLKLTVVLDCCHSGAVTRAESKVRELEWSDQVEEENPVSDANFGDGSLSEEDTFRDATTTESWLLIPQDYSVFVACNPDEYAYECWTKYGRAHGAFTYHFLEVLTKILDVGFNIDVGGIYTTVRDRMHTHKQYQHPRLLGQSQIAFMGSLAPSNITAGECQVNNVRSDRTVSLNIGYVQGVCVGDIYKVFPTMPISAVGRGTQTDVHVKITAVHSVQSDAIQDGNIPLVDIKKGWHAVLTRAHRSRAQVQLFANAGSKWTNEIQKSPYLQLIDPTLAASLPLFKVDLAAHDEYVVSSSHCRDLNMTPVTTRDRHAPARVTAAIEHMAKYASIEQLSNQIASSILGPRTFVSEVTDASKPPSASNNPLFVESNSKIQFTFGNRMSTTLYFVLLDLDPEGAIAKIYPNDRDYCSVSPKDPEVAFEIEMSVPETFRAKGRLQCEDVLKLIVTTRPTSFNALIMTQISEAMENASRGSDEPVWELLDSLDRDDLLEGEWRDGGDDGGRKWTTRNFVIITTMSP